MKIRIGRDKVCALVNGDIDLPSDINVGFGIVLYTPCDIVYENGYEKIRKVKGVQDKCCIQT
ncbi:MAG: nucleotide-binding protein [Clostridia bacterium]|nr:nucleotide-binding protein [Clostridia bacterium]